ncbi:MAG: phage tail protein [Lachnospiraceae bacterium]|nr:phage tail protein [Lachnospiraceae bacterium]
MPKVKFGLKNCHYAKATIKEDGTATYGSPKRLPGAVSITLDPSGDASVFNADDIVYFTAPGSTGYTGSLELALIPDSFLEDCMGADTTTEEGVLLEDADAVASPFALMFEFTTDEKAQKHVMYNVTATRPSIAGQTKGQTTEVKTETLNLTAGSIYNKAADKNFVKAKATAASAPYSKWYEEVWQPGESAED